MPKIPEETARVVIWTVAFIGIVVLIALGKIPASAIEYILFWAAGSVGGQLKLPGASQGSQDQNQGNGRQ